MTPKMLLKNMHRDHHLSHSVTTMSGLCYSLNEIAQYISLYHFRHVNDRRNTVVSANILKDTDTILADLNIRLATKIEEYNLRVQGKFKWNIHRVVIIFELINIGAINQTEVDLIDVLRI